MLEQVSDWDIVSYGGLAGILVGFVVFFVGLVTVSSRPTEKEKKVSLVMMFSGALGVLTLSTVSFNNPYLSPQDEQELWMADEYGVVLSEESSWRDLRDGDLVIVVRDEEEEFVVRLEEGLEGEEPVLVDWTTGTELTTRD